MRTIPFAVCIAFSLIVAACASPALTDETVVPPSATAQPKAPETLTSTASPSGPQTPKYTHPDFDPIENPAGLYQTPMMFSIPFTFTVTNEWGGIGEQDVAGELFGIFPARGEAITFFAVDPLLSYDEVVTMMLETPKFEITPENPVTVDGYSGTQFDFLGSGRIPAMAVFIGHPVVNDNNNWLILPNYQTRYYILQIEERVLLIEFGAPQGSFDTFFATATAIIDTVEFRLP